VRHKINNLGQPFSQRMECVWKTGGEILNLELILLASSAADQAIGQVCQRRSMPHA